MAKSFANAKATTAAKPAPKAAPAQAATEKTEYVPKENEFGAFKEITGKTSGKSFQAIEVAQDITLKKGQLVVFQSLGDELSWLSENGHISAEEAERRNEVLGKWLIGKFRVLPARD